MELLELLFITDYTKEVILIIINKNITGDRVTYGEFLRIAFGKSEILFIHGMKK